MVPPAFAHYQLGFSDFLKLHTYIQYNEYPHYIAIIDADMGIESANKPQMVLKFYQSSFLCFNWRVIWSLQEEVILLEGGRLLRKSTKVPDFGLSSP